jgi:hypothetical protein
MRKKCEKSVQKKRKQVKKSEKSEKKRKNRLEFRFALFHFEAQITKVEQSEKF